MNAATPPGTVGIFWVVGEGATTRLIIDKTPLRSAEAYGAFITSPLGHYAHWTNLHRLSAGTLQRWLDTTAPLHHEYEDWPRGRIVHHRPTARFIIYADAQLHRPAFIDQIRRAFDLHDQPCEVRLDAHYSRTLRLPEPPPEPP